ncbi:MAG TPA: hypothetical protein VKP61_15280 [Candidatus Acidoferrum sp.]|nr:hypothetical protein [Candidatus Acidoferrum sp.]
MNFLSELIFGHSDPLAELRGDIGDAPHPAEAFVKSRIDTSMDPGWSEPVGRAASQSREELFKAEFGFSPNY